MNLIPLFFQAHKSLRFWKRKQRLNAVVFLSGLEDSPCCIFKDCPHFLTISEDCPFDTVRTVLLELGVADFQGSFRSSMALACAVVQCRKINRIRSFCWLGTVAQAKAVLLLESWGNFF